VAPRPSGPMYVCRRVGDEPAGNVAEVRLQLWPGGKDRLLARAGFHGKPVQWLGPEN
jgi:hypothetical protein